MKNNIIIKIAENDFDAGPGFFDPTVFVWAANNAIDSGVEIPKVKRDISRLNRIREKHGFPPVVVPFGHRAF